MDKTYPAIIVKYREATNTRGAKWSVSASGRAPKTYARNWSLDWPVDAARCAAAYAQEGSRPHEYTVWDGPWHGADLPAGSGYVFVRAHLRPAFMVESGEIR